VIAIVGSNGRGKTRSGQNIRRSHNAIQRRRRRMRRLFLLRQCAAKVSRTWSGTMAASAYRSQLGSAEREEEDEAFLHVRPGGHIGQPMRLGDGTVPEAR